jgi:thioredoxin-like negative regulator of GroEL
VIGDLRLQEVLEHPNTWELITFTYYGSASCKHFRPEFTKLAYHFIDKMCAFEISAEENPTITDAFKVIAVPTTLLLHKGIEVNRFEGPYSSEALIERINEAIIKEQT